MTEVYEIIIVMEIASIKKRNNIATKMKKKIAKNLTSSVSGNYIAEK